MPGTNQYAAQDAEQLKPSVRFDLHHASTDTGKDDLSLGALEDQFAPHLPRKDHDGTVMNPDSLVLQRETGVRTETKLVTGADGLYPASGTNRDPLALRKKAGSFYRLRFLLRIPENGSVTLTPQYQMGNFSKSRNATGRGDQEGKDGFHGWNKKGDDQ